jgi:hypothetical protein
MVMFISCYWNLYNDLFFQKMALKFKKRYPIVNIYECLYPGNTSIGLGTNIYFDTFTGWPSYEIINDENLKSNDSVCFIDLTLELPDNFFEDFVKFDRVYGSSGYPVFCAGYIKVKIDNLEIFNAIYSNNINNHTGLIYYFNAFFLKNNPLPTCLTFGGFDTILYASLFKDLKYLKMLMKAINNGTINDELLKFFNRCENTQVYYIPNTVIYTKHPGNRMYIQRFFMYNTWSPSDYFKKRCLN